MSLFDIANFMQVSSSYNNAILFKCRNTGTNNDCENAANAVDDSCTLLLNTANPTVCTGACGVQVSTVATDCASIVSYVSNN